MTAMPPFLSIKPNSSVRAPHGQNEPESKRRGARCRGETEVIRKPKEALFTPFTFLCGGFYLSYTLPPSPPPFSCIAFPIPFPQAYSSLEFGFVWRGGGVGDDRKQPKPT